MSSPPAGKPGDSLLLAMWAEWHAGTVSMATNDELSLEWSMLSEDFYSWDDSDLQLAAELGKTLLERNKELETGLKQQQTVIDDQSQEIEYLSKQSVALREVNDSRLRVYEQLEVSIQELEVTNQRLTCEAGHDKKRIRSLVQTVECLEKRLSELQTLLDELRAAERERRAAASAQQQDRAEERRDGLDQSRADDLAEHVTVLERQLSESRDRERAERDRRRGAEAELSIAQEESLELRQEMAALRERSVKLHSLAEEVHAMEEQRLNSFLRHCSSPAFSGHHQPAAPSPYGVQVAAPVGAAAPPAHSVWGDQSAVVWGESPASSALHGAEPPSHSERLQPDQQPQHRLSSLGGPQLSADQEPQHRLSSLGGPQLSADQEPDQEPQHRLSSLVSPQLSADQQPQQRLSSLGAAQHDSAPASLISDLDAHYRVLLDEMDKYEWMLSSRQPRAATPEQPRSLSLLQELQMSSAAAAPPSPSAELRLASLDAAPLRDSGPDSLMLLTASSDGDASSSGFSEGSADSRTVSRATQTPESTAVPTAMANVMVTGASQTCGMTSSVDGVTSSGRFQQTPQYKQLFQEIFEVLKKPALVCGLPVTSSVASVGAPSAVVESAPTPVEAVEACSAASASTRGRQTSDVTSSPSRCHTAPGKDCEAASEAPAHHPRAFSYAEEFEKCLQQAAPPARSRVVGGAGEASPGVAAVEPAEEFPHLARPSEEVAKLRLLERSYAEALKAGRRCLSRPTLL